MVELLAAYGHLIAINQVMCVLCYVTLLFSNFTLKINTYNILLLARCSELATETRLKPQAITGNKDIDGLYQSVFVWLYIIIEIQESF